MPCERCGVALQPGDWPFCPHGHSEVKAHAVIGDDIPGGMVMEHIEPGRKVYSKTELKQVLANHRSEMWPNGCRLSENGWCGETDQHLKRWISVPWDMNVTREQRQRMMADHLGMTLEEYQQQFS